MSFCPPPAYGADCQRHNKMEDNIGQGKVVGIGNLTKFQQEAAEHSAQDQGKMNQQNLPELCLGADAGHKSTQISVNADADKYVCKGQCSGILLCEIIDGEGAASQKKKKQDHKGGGEASVVSKPVF